ncbi:MAG: MATE family efflux transporter [Acutalibacter sp.]|nr:MATE family efflux transporter [Acutalibacter sp.]
MSQFRKKYIGDRGFYRTVMMLVLPMIAQQGITSFVNLLDNVMVGRLGTIPMSGVAIVNQIVFIFNLTIFGGLSGASIFGAQFFGKGDHKGVRDTFRFRIVFALFVLILGIVIFLLFGESLFRLYLNKDASSAADIAATLSYAKGYMTVTLWGLLPFVAVQVFSSALRDTGETFSPMVASIIAILVNLVLNYLLIFGSFGFPKLGVVGAALATTIARYLEAVYLIVRTYRQKGKFPFLDGAFRSFRVPLPLVKRIAVTGTPLLLNELLWSMGMAAIQVCYATRGLTAVAAVNIEATIYNLFSILVMASGSAIGIMSGQMLGANDIPGAKDTVRKLLFLTVTVNLAMGLLVIGTAPFLPYIYNTEPIVRETATRLLTVMGCFMPLMAFTNGCYFTIRSGGKTFVTFLFDCVFTWVVCLPIAYLVSAFTALSVVGVFLCVQCADFIKALIGGTMIHSGIWANNLVKEQKA